ncbi:hypothetical protein FS749_003557, partial [Ceratobasidium sp. UAMH 11750]
MIIPPDDKKPNMEMQSGESVQGSPAKPRPTQELREDLDREGESQFSSLNPYRSGSAEESAPPRYEDVTPSLSSA